MGDNLEDRQRKKTPPKIKSALGSFISPSCG